MTVEELLYTHLSGDGGVQALVGSRVYPVELPQECTLPAVRYQLISRNELHVHVPSPLLTIRRYQVDGFAVSYASAKALEEALKLALYGFNRQAYACILSTFIESMRDESDPEVNEFSTSMDVLITCSE